MTALDRYIERLNRNPILWSLGLGISIYFCAFWLAVLGMFERFPLSFEIGFLSAGSLVIAYHWSMARYINASIVGQVIQISFGLCLVIASMMLIGATTHHKAYAWVNGWLYG